MSITIGEDKIPFIDLGSGYIIRLEYEDLKDEKYIEKARNELRETPEVVEEALKELRQLIKGESLFNLRVHTLFNLHMSWEQIIFKYLFFKNYEIIKMGQQLF